MLSFPIILDCADEKSLMECIHAAFAVLDASTPKKRERIQFIIVDPPLPLMQLTEKIHRSGYCANFQCCQKEDKIVFRTFHNEAIACVFSGQIHVSWAMEQIFKKSKILINYNGRHTDLDIEGLWYQEVRANHAYDRITILVSKLLELIEDPEAVNCIRRNAQAHYNRYCNQLTKLNLIKAMYGDKRGGSRISA